VRNPVPVPTPPRPAGELIDSLLGQLAGSEDELVAEWGRALLERGESAGSHPADGGARERHRAADRER